MRGSLYGGCASAFKKSAKGPQGPQGLSDLVMCAGSPDEAAKLVQLNLVVPMQLTILLAPQLSKRCVPCS